MTHQTQFLSKDQLLEVYTLTKTATAIHVTENATIQTANDAMLRIWGKDKSVIGKSLEDALPELKGQPFIEMFKKVWNEGLTLSGTDTPANLEIDGKIQTFYFDFEYRAIKDTDGQTLCILHTAVDVSERFFKREALAKAFENERALEKEQALNEELASINEELSATNEELQQAQENLAELNVELENKVAARVNALKESNDRYLALNEEFSALNEELGATVEELSATNEELTNSREKLVVKNFALGESEARFKGLIRQAPVGICVIRVSDLMIQEVNDGYLEVVGRKRIELENRVIWDAVPEVADSYAPILQEVIQTGIPFVAKEHEVVLIRRGAPEYLFIDFVYEPVKDSTGIVTTIMVVAIEVTDK